MRPLLAATMIASSAFAGLAFAVARSPREGVVGLLVTVSCAAVLKLADRH